MGYFRADSRATNVLEMHVALGQFFEHILRFSRDVELRAQIFDFGFGRVELDGHVVEIACVLVKSDSLGDHKSWRGRTLQVCSEVDLFLEVLNLALHLVLVLAGQVSQSTRRQHVSHAVIFGADRSSVSHRSNASLSRAFCFSSWRKASDDGAVFGACSPPLPVPACAARACAISASPRPSSRAARGDGESQETAPDRGKRNRTKPDLPFSSLTTSNSTCVSPSCSSSSFTRAWTSSSSDSAISLSSKLCSTCSCRSSNLDWTESRSARRSLFCESASKSERLEEKAGE